MKEREMEIVAGLIDRVVTDIGNETEYKRVRGDIHELSLSFPLYRELAEN
jgi:glycine/serine hydroxymethyltransferase